jgi:hypothetical protein
MGETNTVRHRGDRRGGDQPRAMLAGAAGVRVTAALAPAAATAPTPTLYSPGGAQPTTGAARAHAQTAGPTRSARAVRRRRPPPGGAVLAPQGDIRSCGKIFEAQKSS